ncbi:MAG: hypothetical protein KDB62_07510 [Solirubrobacterales bacterium]|nr:hypothetical protein [Solirubrobacterales bacterium]
MSHETDQTPSSRIGALAQELMEQVERDTPGARLDQLVISAVLSEDEGVDEQTMHVQLVSDSSDPLSVVGLLTVALDLAKGQLTGE